MKLSEVLGSYDTALLDQIASDKLDETINLRLPKAVVIQEIITALSSQSYIASKILYSKPPAFAILNYILQSPSNSVDVETFRERVLTYVSNLTEKAKVHRSLPGKHVELYKKILRRAWENDGLIDKSESHILELIKQEFGIWDREHFTIMHDPMILSLWEIEKEYFWARNYLLATGIILTYENSYLIAEEVASQVRRTFGIEIMDDPYKRLLTAISKEELSIVLERYHLHVSGSKESMIERVLDSLIPATEVLNCIHLDNLREICRHYDIQVSGTKNTVVTNIIRFFDENSDLKPQINEEPASLLPSVPEPREMDEDRFKKVLLNLTGQQLYDILYHGCLMTSGTKDEKIARIIDSPWSERSLFNYLRKEDIAQLFRRFDLPVSGSKQELVDRLLDFVTPTQNDLVIPIPEDQSPTVSIPAPQPITAMEISVEPISNPTNYEDIDRQFNDLNSDEKIVLSILKEAKSITEQELSRIVSKYKLNWVLYKAHMAELIAKLKRIGKSVIQIKSVQNSNIYQWTENENLGKNLIEKKSARDVIDALRHGVVPRMNLDLLMVGQQPARKHLSEILLEVGPHKSHFKFIRGQYGSGKTFLCSWLKEFALDNEFAVSFLNISHDQPLSDLPVFFSGMINALRTPEKLDSCALVDILEAWLLQMRNKTSRIEGIEASKINAPDFLKLMENAIEAELANLNGIESGFSQAMRTFYDGKVNNDLELISNTVAWITGSRSLSAQSLRQIGVKGFLEANNVFPRMRAILEIIGGARYKGLLLLVDELELVRKFPHARQREQALETLRLLIDEAGRNALPGCLVIFTGTDEFFEDERYGLKSYEALAERVMTPITHDTLVSMRQPIISLEALDKERLINVVCKVRDLYGLAYNWNANQFASNEAINQLIEEWTVFGQENIDRKPRPILREFIQMLDLCEENKGISLSQFLKKKELTPID